MGSCPLAPWNNDDGPLEPEAALKARLALWIYDLDNRCAQCLARAIGFIGKASGRVALSCRPSLLGLPEGHLGSQDVPVAIRKAGKNRRKPAEEVKTSIIQFPQVRDETRQCLRNRQRHVLRGASSDLGDDLTIEREEELDP